MEGKVLSFEFCLRSVDLGNILSFELWKDG